MKETDNALYRKVGRRYVATNMLMPDAYSLPEGVWVVTKNRYSTQTTSSNYLKKVFNLDKASDIENVSLAKLGGMQKLANHLCQNLDKVNGETTYDRCCQIVKILFDYKDEQE
jgi:hypothetical protein